MLKNFYIFLFLIFGGIVLGQSFKLSGKLIDETKQAASGPSVLLLNTDSSLVKATTADINGLFVLENISSNNYV